MSRTLKQRAKGELVTDLSKWRLKNVCGRQTWHYDEEGKWGREQTLFERHALGLDTVTHVLLYCICQSMQLNVVCN